MTYQIPGDQSPINVIYARASVDPQQNPNACDQQVARCVRHLTAQGLDPTSFVVITDAGAEPGPSPGFEHVRALLQGKRLRTLAAASLDRLGRADWVINVLRDVVFAGGRVMIAESYVDTDCKGWEALVRLASMHVTLMCVHCGKPATLGAVPSDMDAAAESSLGQHGDDAVSSVGGIT